MLRIPGLLEVILAMIVLCTAFFSMKIGIVIAVLLLLALALRMVVSDIKVDKTFESFFEQFIDVRTKLREKHLEDIFFLASEKKEITNKDVKKLCGVSVATAGRYLDDLEKAGKLKQVVKMGKNVVYMLSSIQG
jgi:Fic family protein